MLSFNKILSLAASKNLIHKHTNVELLRKETLNMFTEWDAYFLKVDKHDDFDYLYTELSTDLIELWFPDILNLFLYCGLEWKNAYSLDASMYDIVKEHYKRHHNRISHETLRKT